MAITLFFKNKHTHEIDGSIVCPTWLWGAVKAEARAQRVSENTILKHALREYLKKYNPNLKDLDNKEDCPNGGEERREAKRFFIRIKAETGTVEFTPETKSLSELQGLVGGYIQQLTERESGLVILCDEEARLKGEVPINNIASSFYEEILLGDVVICKCDYNNGEYVGWTKEECEKVCKDYSLC